MLTPRSLTAILFPRPLQKLVPISGTDQAYSIAEEFSVVNSEHQYLDGVRPLVFGECFAERRVRRVAAGAVPRTTQPPA